MTDRDDLEREIRRMESEGADRGDFARREQEIRRTAEAMNAPSGLNLSLHRWRASKRPPPED